MDVPGQHVTQVHVVFQVPAKAASELFKWSAPPTHLAYVEWFSPFPPEPEHDHLMYRILRSYKRNCRFATIVPVTAIKRSIYLFPQFGCTVPPHWQASTVLEQCPTFYVNPFIDKSMYKVLN
jgi:hypothetical protein